MRNDFILTILSGRIKPKFALTVMLAFSVFFISFQSGYANKALQEKQQITGVVTDGSTNEPLPGVSILIKGTSAGTITDMDGNYSMEAASGDVLVFSFIGYLSEEVEVGTSTEINISLVEDIIGLDEVVVVGYGIQKKSDLTGAVASVSGEKLNEIPSIGVDQALQGRAAGVNVIQSTGMPGGTVNIQIRGITSVNGTNPLVVVDGVRTGVSLSDLNPGDIQSIEILKDASSTAIYGVSGGNGVILVTTKKGQAGTIRTNFNYYRGWANPWKKIDLMDAQQYAQAMNIIKGLQGQDPWTTMPDTLGNYDYQDIMFRTAVMENVDFSIAGGSERSTFFASANYQREDGILRKSDYERLAFRINSEHKLSKLITVGQNASFRRRLNNGFEEWQYQNEYNSPLIDVLRMVPYLPPYDENGDWSLVEGGQANPQCTQDVTNKQRKSYTTVGDVYVNITPVKGLVFTSKINGYLTNTVSDVFNRVYSYTPVIQNDRSSVEKEMTREYGWEWQNYINYNVTLASMHNIGVTLGMEAISAYHDNIKGKRYDLFNETPEMRYFDASTDAETPEQIVEGKGWEEAHLGYFGRLNYDFRGKYLVSVAGRIDQSSLFGQDKRTGFFPSFSAGWKFSEESFMDNVDFLSFGKIRYGYGTTGANPPDRYAYTANVGIQPPYAYVFGEGDVANNGAFLVKLPNPEMGWETVVMSNLGVDLAFLSNKIEFTFDYFTRTSKDMLINNNIPSIAGMYQAPNHVGSFGNIDARPTVNLGSIENKGLEFSIGYRKREGDLKANFDLNFTYVKNEVIDMASDSSFRGTSGVNLSNICLTTEGQPIAQFNGLITEGLFTLDDVLRDANGDPVYDPRGNYILTTGYQPQAQPGDLRFADLNGDSAITDADRVNIGSPIPKFIFGFSINLEYKGFDMNIFLEGKFGHKLFNASKLWLMAPNTGSIGPNCLTDLLNQYYEDIYDEEGNLLYPGNYNTDLPRLDPTNANGNFVRVSDFYVESGNYVRVKSLQFGYTIPLSLTSKVGVEKLRVYIGAKNLFTFTKYSGFDPEVGPGKDSQGRTDMLQQGIDKVGNYPHSRMFFVGVNLQF